MFAHIDLPHGRAPILTAAAAVWALAVACGSGGGTIGQVETATPVPQVPISTPGAGSASRVAPPTSAASTPAGEISMGGSALGGNAATTLLAQVAFEITPGDSVTWLAHEIRLTPGQVVQHSHEFAFVYALAGSHTLTLNGQPVSVPQGAGTWVAAAANHRHGGLGGDVILWEIRLAAEGAGFPPGVVNAREVFQSEVLQGIPDQPLGVFVLVRVPPGGQTSVHTHPGPEFIYQLSGEIDYENALIGETMMVPGEFEGVVPETAVQKRNPSDSDAIFLSWFLVDPDKPFASATRFDVAGDRGENMASLSTGARVSAVSSNYASGTNGSAFGADKAIDGDPHTEWSSDGDGNDAWIEIELASEIRVSAVGFWTRTMGTSAEVTTFQVVTDRGETAGPFELGSAGRGFYVDTGLTARRLRFETLDSSGGNTGAVEIEVYGELTAGEPD